MTESEWFSAPAATPMDGSEQFAGLESTVRDFWRFAMSDLRVNNVRGYLAEFLVARAVGASGARVEWDEYDVLAPDGTKIEVKSSAYLQVWDQRRPSRIVFTGLTGRTWTARSGESPEATFNADVYVFCVQTASSHEVYDALDVSQWTFYILARQTLEQIGYKSISLSSLERLAKGPIAYAELAGAIKVAADSA